MDLRRYYTLIRKSLVWLLLGLVLGALAGYGVARLTPPTYASTVDFYVSTPLPDGTSAQSAGQFAQARVNSYVSLLSSEELATRIQRATRLDMSPAQIARHIKGSAETDTVLLTATVTDSDAQRSLLIAQGLAKTFGPMVDELDNQGRRSAVVVIKVVSGPSLKSSPVEPRPTLYTGLGALLGLGAVFVVVLLRDLLDVRVHDAETAQELVGAPTIGDIPKDATAAKDTLLSSGHTASARAEAHRQLRTNLFFVDAAKTARTLAVTSAMPGEGKSVVAVNMAEMLVEAGEKVLLIEADVRRPHLGERLGIDAVKGLSDTLAAQVELADVIVPVEAAGFDVLPAGTLPPNPAELLGSGAMAAVLETAARDYGRIIIDCPPVLPVTDAAVVSTLVDGVVFVVRQGKATRHQVSRASAALRRVGARVLGVVVNGTRRGSAGYYDSTPYATKVPRRQRNASGRSVTHAELD